MWKNDIRGKRNHLGTQTCQVSGGKVLCMILWFIQFNYFFPCHQGDLCEPSLGFWGVPRHAKSKQNIPTNGWRISGGHWLPDIGCQGKRAMFSFKLPGSSRNMQKNLPFGRFFG